MKSSAPNLMSIKGRNCLFTLKRAMEIRKCFQCLKKFPKSKDLLNHIRSAVCSDGKNKKAKRKDPDANDETYKPPETKEWKCRFCDAVLSCYVTRRWHENAHTGEKPYQCRKGCDERFRDPNYRR